MKKSIILISTLLAAGTLGAWAEETTNPSYAGTVYTYVSTTSTLAQATLAIGTSDVASTTDDSTGVTTYSATATGTTGGSWTQTAGTGYYLSTWGSAQTGGISGDGTDSNLNTLRFVAGGTKISISGTESTVATASAVSVDFGNLVLGGLIVDEDATGWGIAQSSTRTFVLGSSASTFYGTIGESFTLTAGTMSLYGSQEWTVASGKTMTFSGGTAVQASANVSFLGEGNVSLSGTLSIGAGATVTVGNTGTFAVTGALSGSGTIDLGTTGTLASVANTWTGTVKIAGRGTGSASSATAFTLNNYGRAGSTIEISGFYGYFSEYNSTVAANLVLENGDYGYAIRHNNGSSSATMTFTGAISGSGTFQADKNPSNGHVVQAFTFTGDLSGFTGKFEAINSVNAGTLTFGAGTETAVQNLSFDIAWRSSAVADDKGYVKFNYGEANVNYSGTVTSGNILKEGSGTMTVSDTNSFVANTLTVNGGVMNLNISGTQLSTNSNVVLSSGTTTVAEGATLNVYYGYTGSDSGIQYLGLDGLNIAEGATLAIYSANNRWGLNFSSHTINGTLLLGSADRYSAQYTLTAQTLSNMTLEIGENTTVQSYNTVTLENVTITGAGTLKAHYDSQASTQILAISDSTISAKISVELGATLNLSGTIDINTAITNEGTVTVVDSTIFLLDNLEPSTTGTGDDEVRTYTLVSGGTVSVLDSAGSYSSLTESNFQFEGGLLSSRKTVTVTAGTGLTVAVSGAVADLVWAGGNTGGTWLSSTEDSNKVWTNQKSEIDYFVQNDNVTFNTANAVITVADGVEAKNLTISDDVTLAFTNQTSGTTTFAVNQTTTIAEGKTLTLQSNLQNNGMSSQTVALNATGTGTISVDHQSSDHNLSLSVGDGFTGTLVWAGNLNPTNLTNYENLNSLTLKTTTEKASGNTNTTSSIWSSGAVTLDVNTTISGAYGFQVATTFNGSLTGDSAEIASGTVTAAGTASGSFTVADGATFTVSGTVERDSTLTVAGGTTTFTGTNSGTIAVADGATLDFGNVLSTAGTVNGGTVTGSTGATVSLNLANAGWYNYVNLGTDFTGTVEIHAKSGTSAKGLVMINSETEKVTLGDGATIKFFDATGFANSIAGTANYNIVFAGTANTFQSNSSNDMTDKTLTIGGTLEILLGATAEESNGRVAVTGLTTVGGTLNMTTTQTLTLNGGLAGAGAINLNAKSGYNTTLILNDDGSAYTGTITVASSGNGGILEVNHEKAIAGATLVNNGSVTLGVESVSVKSIDGTGTLAKADSVASSVLIAETSSFSGTISENVTLVAQALTGTISLGANATIVAKSGTIGTITTTADTAKVELSASVTEGSITLAEGSKIVISNDFVSSTIDPGSPSTISESETASLNIIAASALSVADTSVDWSAATSDTIASYFEYNEDFYGAATFACSNGIITMTYAIPEPSMFGLLAGTLALALAGTRRRRKNAK